MSSYKKRKAIRQGLCVALSVLCILTLAACGGQSDGKESKPPADNQGVADVVQETEEVFYEKWTQPDESELKTFLKEKVDLFSTQVLSLGDAFKAELKNCSYDNIEDSDLYSEWKAVCLAWAYGAQNFDVSAYDCDETLSGTLQKCGELAAKFPDAFKASYYQVTDSASQEFSALADELESELYALVEIAYAKDVEPLTEGALLEGNKFVSFTFKKAYYVTDRLRTQKADGIVYVVPEQHSILVLEFTVKNVFSQTLTYANTGVMSMDDYIKVSAVVDGTYEYDGDIYVESPYGYSAIKDSFSDVTPLEERIVYAVIDMPAEAKELPALVSTEYNGTVYQYTCN